MNTRIQVIEHDGKPEWAIVPYEIYLKLVEEAEMLADLRDYDTEKASIEKEEQELVPAELTFAILDGQNPVKVWREYRRLSQQQLADAAGISRPYLAQIETNKRTGSTASLLAIAKALEVSIDDIVIQAED